MTEIAARRSRAASGMAVWLWTMWLAGATAAQDGYAMLNGGTTGGAGGQVVRATTGTEIHQAICSRPKRDTPLIIHVEGTINHANTEGVSGDSCDAGSGDDRIELKGIESVSLIGVGQGAVFDELGIHVRESSNIILQNLHIRNVKKSGSPTSNGGDAIGMESDVFNVWVDHCTLEASGGESEGYDALFDLKATTRYVTLSYSILRNSGRGGLIGSSDSDDTNGPVTFHHNLYQQLDSRTPLLRHGTAHAYNNHYDGIHKSGMNPRIGGRIKAENNFFENAKDPLGTFYTDDMGYWEVSGNRFADTVTWSSDGSDNHPAGPDPVSTTSIDIPYAYALDDAACVPEIVAATAGAGRGLLRSDGACGTAATPDPQSEPNAGRDMPGTPDAGMAGADLDAGPTAQRGDAGVPSGSPAPPTAGAGGGAAPVPATPGRPAPVAPDAPSPGVPMDGDVAAQPDPGSIDEGGCDCRIAPGRVPRGSRFVGPLLLAGLLALRLGRRRRQRARLVPVRPPGQQPATD